MRTLEFSGHMWQASDQNAWVDDNGYLHLTITRQEGIRWKGSQVTLTKPVGYGTYKFFLIGRIDLIEPAFLAFCSLDDAIEMRFSNFSSRDIVYPNNASYSVNGNTKITGIELNGTHTTHHIRWEPEKVMLRSVHGHAENGVVIKEYIYPESPVSGTQRATIGVAYKDPSPPAYKGLELIVTRFTFQPV